MPQLLSLCAKAHQVQLLSPHATVPEAYGRWSLCSTAREATAVRNPAPQNNVNLSARGKTVKFLEENAGICLCDIRLGNDFLDMTPKAQVAKRQIGLC